MSSTGFFNLTCMAMTPEQKKAAAKQWIIGLIPFAIYVAAAISFRYSMPDPQKVHDISFYWIWLCHKAYWAYIGMGIGVTLALIVVRVIISSNTASGKELTAVGRFFANWPVVAMLFFAGYFFLNPSGKGEIGKANVEHSVEKLPEKVRNGYYDGIPNPLPEEWVKPAEDATGWQLHGNESRSVNQWLIPGIGLVILLILLTKINLISGSTGWTLFGGFVLWVIHWEIILVIWGVIRLLGFFLAPIVQKEGAEKPTLMSKTDSGVSGLIVGLLLLSVGGLWAWRKFDMQNWPWGWMLSIGVCLLIVYIARKAFADHQDELQRQKDKADKKWRRETYGEE